jgi:phosphatidylserine/phosphatidylglycerophosphate/cardiolipin synthase-like enzyme
MRCRQESNGISVHAISGTWVVILGFNATECARQKLLGFALHRTDHTEDEAYWLKGFKTFEQTEPNPPPGSLFSTLEHPLQTFQWGDYTAKPDHEYTYKVVPLYGKPKNIKMGDAVEVKVSTESEDTGTHAVFFNRGVAASQAYVRKFQNRKPDDVPGREAFKWLSRGLEEAILRFIGQANGEEYGLRAAVYEFNYLPVLEAFKQASESGADVKIVYDARKDNPREASEEAIACAGIKCLVIPRKATKSYISHNKFIVLLKNGQPQEVWTGSTNFTRGGIFGQSNVGHIIRDPKVAASYLRYWENLAKDPEAKDLRKWTGQETADPDGAPSPNSIMAIFSPRKSLKALEWYAEQMDDATQMVNLTAAFGVNKKLAEVLGKDKDYLRFLLLERRGKNYDVYAKDRDVQVSIGSKIEDDTLYRWTREKLTNFNFHVRYIHTKYMLIDALTDNPTVITGSANFSDASTKENDENMVVIQDDTRVADIYLGEFMRLFHHFYFRYIANKMKAQPGSEERKVAYLVENGSWTDKYYQDYSIKKKKRLLFA